MVDHLNESFHQIDEQEAIEDEETDKQMFDCVNIINTRSYLYRERT